MRTIATVLLLTIATHLFAQRECASHTYIEDQKASNPALAYSMNAVENFIQQQSLLLPTGAPNKTYSSAANSIIYIPVVVHVVYNTAAQNISDAQVQSQIDALNRDFRKLNADTVNIPSQFKSLAADVEIEFVLATADPKGRGTTGIVRKHTDVAEFRTDDKIKYSAQGGDDAWDANSYLNLWVGSMHKVLGYSSVPGCNAAIDGVVINYTAFGTINTSAPYNLGRTAVHEVGHWFGLRHIWGDAACGDDMVDDTPKQSGFTSGAPTGYRTSCNNAPVGDMYMNYMDFTDDVRLTLFTKGQKERMRAMFNSGGPRYALLSSKGLSTPWVEAAPLPVVEEIKTAHFQLYPNPATTEVILNFGTNNTWIGKELLVINMSGMQVQKVIVDGTTQRVNVNALKPGVYFLQGMNGTEKIAQKIIKL